MLLQSEAHLGGIQANKIYHLALAVQSTNVTVTLSDDGGSNTTLTTSDDGLESGSVGLQTLWW